MSRVRRWLAVGLSVLQPGLGHAYLREWLRAVTWFLLWVTAILVVAPLPDNPGPTDVARYVTGSSAIDALSPVATVTLMAVVAVTAMDAYRHAATTGRSDPDEPTCPSCGKEVDTDLDFCHWCSTDFEAARE